MDLSILIPSKGRSAQLPALVTHLHAMMPAGLDFEILIRDASPVEQVVPIHGAQVMASQDSPGEAFNHMAEDATGTYLFPLGDDMRLYPRTVPLALSLMAGVPKSTVG